MGWLNLPSARVRPIFRSRGRRLSVVLAAVLTLLTAGSQAVYANVALTPVSTDTLSGPPTSQHKTELEPDTFAFGSTIVTAFQVGRVPDGGSSDIGWATSSNRGSTWSNGFLPGLTGQTVPRGQYERASDPSVAFDARHNVWLISSLGVNGPAGNNAVFTSRSANGGLTWSTPVTVATGALDKNWIVCDNTSSSPFFGNCYTEFDITSAGNAIRLSRSTDGGLTWRPPIGNSSGASGLGGQPVVRPNGTVIVPHLSGSQIGSFRSIDGGASWRATVVAASVSHHTTAGGLRVNTALPSAEIDSAGTVYLAWPDCRFRSGCTSNDIVLSKSTSETTWAAPTRIPIDPTSSTVDHFTPGIGVDPSSAGSGAHIGLTYYYYPTANCSSATCQLDVGYVSSTNGGTSWSTPTAVAGPMSLSWLPNTTQGRMFGDYISTSVLAGGNAFAALPVASASGNGSFNQAMFVPTSGLPVTGGALRTAAAEIAHPQASPTQRTALQTAN
jgi:hypothetical protein